MNNTQSRDLGRAPILVRPDLSGKDKGVLVGGGIPRIEGLLGNGENSIPMIARSWPLILIPHPKHLALLAAPFALICTGHAAAQTPAASRPDPLPFVQAATACVRSAGTVPEEWRRTLQRAQLWSLYYGYSLAQTFSRSSDTRPANCETNMGRLDAALTNAERTFAAGWRDVQSNARAIQNARALLGINPDYAQGWCAALISDATNAMRRDPSLLGFDPATAQGQERIAAAGAEFDNLTLFWDQRSLDARRAGGAGAGTARDEFFRASNDSVAYGLSIVQHRDTALSVVRAAKGNHDLPAALDEATRLRLTTELAACRAARALDADQF